ncbi:MAG: SDR family oxidoreductase [Pseudomonadales bacterium]|nr:SDR family oxidoreductase [Pseudomonadales bacterium]
MKQILITGANRGIGLELVRQCLAADWQVIACCREPGQAGELQSLQCEQLEIVRLDVSDPSQVAALGGQMQDRTLDVLVNNAGVMGGEHQTLFDLDFDAWEETFRVNTLAPVRMIATLVPALERASLPRILTISSQMGAMSRDSKGAYIYRTSKAAVNKAMQLVANELAERGIIACPVHPGWVKTDMGGPHADIDVTASASGILALIDRLKPEDSGEFFNWNGTPHPW